MNDMNVLYEDEALVVSSERTIPAAPYPHKYVHCVLDDLKDAVSAVCGLRTIGYAAEDIHVLASRDFVEAVHKQQCQQKHGFARVLVWLTSLLDDGFCTAYLREALNGRHILAVRLPGSERMEETRDLLIFHRAQLIKYVDTWAVADLQPSLAQEWAVSVLADTPRRPYR